METHDFDIKHKNPNDSSQTCLELYCQFKGWQGGTLQCAFNDYKALDILDKDKFCSMLLDNMINISDIERMKSFMSMRVNHLS